MVTKHDDGGQAFPRSVWTGSVDEMKAEAFNNGMTLRDYFAGQALAGIVGMGEAFNNPSMAAGWAYQYADQMLEARQK